MTPWPFFCTINVSEGGGGKKGGKRGGQRGLVLGRMEFVFTSVNQDSQNQQATSKQVKIQYDVKQVYS